ncbi:unnamed protein product [Schistocephalus solidus]|uniref:Reverse transcriptase domain-containing protein n=1 Tax=Schistocephalus solidus TaxID=70667 RepID=A0A3P7D215_SCHSO|nr:unnamed protein product [Schistocephalus solidus]
MPKIHKLNVPLRPIVALKDTPTYGPSKWLAKHLKKLVDGSELTAVSSTHFLEKLRGITIAPDEIMVSFDVVSLFTSITKELAMRFIDYLLERRLDASNAAFYAVLQQHIAAQTKLLAFFSESCLPGYLTMKQFQHLLAGRDFPLFLDHKSLSFALKSNFDKLNPRRFSKLTISTIRRRFDGSRNEAAVALSRPSCAPRYLTHLIDQAGQRRVGSLCDEDASGLQMTAGNENIISDV